MRCRAPGAQFVFDVPDELPQVHSGEPTNDAAASIAAIGFILASAASTRWIAMSSFVVIGASVGVIAPLTLLTGARGYQFGQDGRQSSPIRSVSFSALHVRKVTDRDAKCAESPFAEAGRLIDPICYPRSPATADPVGTESSFRNFHSQ